MNKQPKRLYRVVTYRTVLATCQDDAEKQAMNLPGGSILECHLLPPDEDKEELYRIAGELDEH